jgi:hypothetical protein
MVESGGQSCLTTYDARHSALTPEAQSMHLGNAIRLTPGVCCEAKARKSAKRLIGERLANWRIAKRGSELDIGHPVAALKRLVVNSEAPRTGLNRQPVRGGRRCFDAVQNPQMKHVQTRDPVRAD